MTTFYEKVGKRYQPVLEGRLWESWPAGFHLIYADPEGGRLYRFNINADKAGLEVAARAKEAELRRVLNEALAMRPTKRPVTEKQEKAWKAFRKAMGNDGYIVEYESVHGIIDRMVEVLVGRDG